jgi:hypothetical protein
MATLDRTIEHLRDLQANGLRNAEGGAKETVGCCPLSLFILQSLILAGLTRCISALSDETSRNRIQEAMPRPRSADPGRIDDASRHRDLLPRLASLTHPSSLHESRQVIRSLF